MIKIPSVIKSSNLNARMLLQVHDELIFEVPKSEVEALIPIIKGSMENAANLSVPLLVDIGFGDNWNDAH